MRIPWTTDAGPSECHFYIFRERPRCLVTRLLLQSPSPDLSEDDFAELVAGDCGGRWGHCPYEAIVAQVLHDDLMAAAADSGAPLEPETSGVEEVVGEIAEAVEAETAGWGMPKPRQDVEARRPAEVEFSKRRPDLEEVFCDAAIVATDEFLAGRSASFAGSVEDRLRDEVMTFARPIQMGTAVSTSGCGSGHPLMIHCVTHGLGSRPSSMEEAYAVASIGLKLADDERCRSVSILDVFAGFEPEQKKFLLEEFANRCSVEPWRHLELIIIYPGEDV